MRDGELSGTHDWEIYKLFGLSSCVASRPDEQILEIQDGDFSALVSKDEAIDEAANREIGLAAKVRIQGTAEWIPATMIPEIAVFLPAVNFETSNPPKSPKAVICVGPYRKRISDLSQQVRSKPDFRKIPMQIPVVLDYKFGTGVYAMPMYQVHKNVFASMVTQTSGAPAEVAYFFLIVLNLSADSKRCTFHLYGADVPEDQAQLLTFDLDPGRWGARQIGFFPQGSAGNKSIHIKAETLAMTIGRAAASVGAGVALGAVGAVIAGHELRKTGTTFLGTWDMTIKFELLDQAKLVHYKELASGIISSVERLLNSQALGGFTTKYGDSVTRENVMSTFKEWVSPYMLNTFIVNAGWKEDSDLASKMFWRFVGNRFGINQETAK